MPEKPLEKPEYDQASSATLPGSGILFATRRPLVVVIRRVMQAAVSVLALWLEPRMALWADDPPNPVPRPLVVGELLRRWDFDAAEPGWTARHQCSLTLDHGVLRIESSGHDPYLDTSCSVGERQVLVRLRLRAATSGDGSVYWAAANQAGFSEARNVRFAITHDGQWHEYQVSFVVDDTLTAIRLDPGSAAGVVELDWLAIHRGGPHPLQLTRLISSGDQLQVVVRNHGDRSREATVDGQMRTLAANQEAAVALHWPPPDGLRQRIVRLESPGLPPLERRFWQFPAEGRIDSVSQQLGESRIELARDGSLARWYRGGRVVAVLAPLVHRDGELPRLQLTAGDSWPLVFQGDGVRLELSAVGENELRVMIESPSQVEGPVVRTLGGLEQGLVAGVEYLGHGEQSSSRLDIETDQHLRFEPHPMHLTMPLMACVTDRVSTALMWDDNTLQPTFAAPDFVDFAAGHRMSLKGRRIGARLRVDAGWADGGRLESAILWAVRQRGLPPVPTPPRGPAEQQQLSLAAYQGQILDREHGGWFHAVVPGVRRMPERGVPFADCASAIFRLTGKLPSTGILQPGGAHVNNACGFFLAGQASVWLRQVNTQAQQLRGGQRADGSFRYDGKFRRGHFENTASGICAQPAHLLLEHARLTGNQDSLAAGLKALEFLQRFRTPRGAQTWEVPLHTPDILAAAHLVWAHVRAWELTGQPRYLERARRWAITGLPFVYQWSNRPIMNYATIAVFGATDWTAPNWIGLPVQWCGTVYAYALLLLAPHDQTLHWRQVAEGILVCSEQMQYPDGPSRGCLPDVFSLGDQRRMPADINPGAMVSLRLRLAGELDDVDVAASGDHRIVAPFPVRIDDERAIVTAPPDTSYQVVIDGLRIVDVQSTGRDSIPLAPPKIP